jgi:hypothetical protein
MSNHIRHLAVLTVIAAGVLPATGAQAQYHDHGGHYMQPTPLYPYEVQDGSRYVVQVAPDTYAVRCPAAPRTYPYVHCLDGCGGRWEYSTVKRRVINIREQATVGERYAKKRVVQVDAEVTILGPDSMTIRLFRKGQGSKTNRRAQ